MNLFLRARKRWLSGKQGLENRGRRLELEPLEDRLLLTSSLPSPVQQGGLSALNPPASMANPPASTAPATPVATVNIPSLHSNPGAPAALWLDFGGLPPQDWLWTAPARDTATAVGLVLGGLPGAFLGNWLSGKVLPKASTPQFDLDGTPSCFTPLEGNAMTEIWARVSEAYAPFNIDVTTVAPCSCTQYSGTIIRVSIGGDGSWVPGGSSETGLGVPPKLWGSAGKPLTGLADNTVFVFSDKIKASHGSDLAGAIGDIAVTAAHEAGHAFGLYHQGEVDAKGNVVEYSPGTSERGFIMGEGAPTDAKRNTWWRGGPNLINGVPFAASPGGIQDDMAVIAGPDNGFGYRPEDPNGSMARAAPLKLDAKTHALVGQGIIRKNQANDPGGKTEDVDYFSFSAQGVIDVQVDVARTKAAVSGTDVIIGNLHPKIELTDQYGNVLASDDPDISSHPLNLDATIHFDPFTARITVPGTYPTSVPLDEPGLLGQYYLVVRSHGEYGDVGKFTVNVTEESGPKVVDASYSRSWAAFNEPMQINIAFNEPIPSLTSSNLLVTDARGNWIPVADSQVQAVDASRQQFTIQLASVPLGGFRLMLEPTITNQFGRAMQRWQWGYTDQTPPAVTGVTTWTRDLQVTFSEPIDPASFTAAAISRLTDASGRRIAVGGPISAVADSNNTQFDIPLAAVPVGGYNLVLGSSIRDLWGNALDTTRQLPPVRDSSPPNVKGQELHWDTTAVAPGPAAATPYLLVLFDKAIDTGTLTLDQIVVRGAGGQVATLGVTPAPDDLAPGCAGRCFVVTFTAPSLVTGKFTLQVGTKVADVFGNRLKKQHKATFDVGTAPQTGPVLSDTTMGQLAQLASAGLTRSLPAPGGNGGDPLSVVGLGADPAQTVVLAGTQPVQQRAVTVQATRQLAATTTTGLQTAPATAATPAQLSPTAKLTDPGTTGLDTGLAPVWPPLG
jgi:hypothetical protein